jgi:demethoxyubiquinone hydroxylase (CLK1/Coq7/Cat5 family)
MANEDVPAHETEQPEEVSDDFTIRPPMQQSDIKLRRAPASVVELNAMKKALRTLHSLEIMAVNIYRFQISKENSELNENLISAMCNEMTHVQDFQVKLYEYGLSPSKVRWAWWIVGFTFGLFSRFLGKRMILKTAMWVESKAVAHYGELLNAVRWDAETLKIIEKDRSDEQRHIEQWKVLLETA